MAMTHKVACSYKPQYSCRVISADSRRPPNLPLYSTHLPRITRPETTHGSRNRLLFIENSSEHRYCRGSAVRSFVRLIYHLNGKVISATPHPYSSFFQTLVFTSLYSYPHKIPPWLPKPLPQCSPSQRQNLALRQATFSPPSLLQPYSLLRMS
jgi:hypothetical protein